MSAANRIAGGRRGRRCLLCGSVLAGCAVLAILLLQGRDRAPGSAARATRAGSPPGHAAVDARTPSAEEGPQPGAGALDSPRHATVCLTVLDLATGQPVSGVPVVVHAYEGDEELTTDAAGGVRFDPEGVGTVEVAAAEWRECRLRHRDPLVDGALWVYRLLRVEGVVRTGHPDDRFNAEDVRISAFVDEVAPDTASAARAGAGALPDWEDRWRLVRRVSRSGRAVGDDGHFRIELPRVRGLVIGASCDGWLPDTARLDAFMNDTTAEVLLTLERGWVVRGQLADEAGNPLANQTVWAFTIVPVATSDVSQYSRLQYRAPGGSFGGAGDLITGLGFAKYQRKAVTDEQGRFELGVCVEGGETWVFGYVTGRAPFEAELGALSRDLEDVHLVARKPDRDVSLRVLVDAVPLSREAVLLTDLDYGKGEAQPAIQLETDSSGSIPAAWLQAGRRYSLSHLRRGGEGPLPGGCFEWTGQSTVDLTRDVGAYDDVIQRR